MSTLATSERNSQEVARSHHRSSALRGFPYPSTSDGERTTGPSQHPPLARDDRERGDGDGAAGRDSQSVPVTPQAEKKDEMYIMIGIGGVALLGFLCFCLKNFRKCCKRCKRRVKKSKLIASRMGPKVSPKEQEQFSMLDKILFAPDRPGGKIMEKPKRAKDDSTEASDSDLSSFADLMAESFSKNLKVRDEMEKRYSFPLY